MDCRHQARPGLGEFRPGQLTAGQTCSRKAPAITTLALTHNVTKTQKFLPTAIRWSVGTFARLIGSAFAFTQMNQLRDCHLRIRQTSRRHTKNFASVCYTRPNNVSHVAVARTTCHVGTKCARTSIAPSSEPQTDSDRVISSLLFRLEQKKQEQREETVKFVDFSHSSRKAWSTINKLTGRSAWSFCLCPVSTKLCRLAALEEQGTQDQGPRGQLFSKPHQLAETFCQRGKNSFAFIIFWMKSLAALENFWNIDK